MLTRGIGGSRALAALGLTLATTFVLAGCAHQIQGYVQDPAGPGVAGVTMTFSGEGSGVTELDGYYSHSVPHGWSGTVTPEKPPLTFDPVVRRYENVSRDLDRQLFWVKDGGGAIGPPVVTLPPIVERPVVTPPVVDPRDGPDTPKPPTHIVTPPKPYESPLTKAEKRTLVDAYRISVLNVGVVSEERLALAGGERSSDICLRSVRGWLANHNFRIQQAGRGLKYESSAAQMAAFAKENDLALIVLLRGTSKQFDKFGNYYLFKADLDGKVVKSHKGELIAERAFTRSGKRSRDQAEAAEDALRAAATEAVTYLSDEIIRQCRRLHTTTLNLRNIEDLEEVEDVLRELRGRPGIAYASLEQWSEKSQTAVVEIVHSTVARDNLGVYLETLQSEDVEVERRTKDYADAERD